MTFRLVCLLYLVLGIADAFQTGNSPSSRRPFIVSLLWARRERSQRPEPPSSATTRERRAPTKIQRAPHQFDHTKEQPRPFLKDPLEEIMSQDPNENAKVYEVPGDSDRPLITHQHVTSYALDDIFPNLGLSQLFNTNTEFRQELRNAMREDIFDTTPAYHDMSEKARKFLLLPDSSLQGSWKCNNGGWSRADQDDKSTPRMQRLTAVLQSYLGDQADVPSGDEFMDTIGALCGEKPSTHWMDIVGVLNRRIPHSWHQDTGDSTGNKKTVLLGFPPTDNYEGVGVFSHLVKLQYEQVAPVAHAINEPVLFNIPDMPQECIVRPLYKAGKQEIIVYRDVDVLHSSPDIAHRLSVMRFM